MPNIGQGKITTAFDHKLRPAKTKTVSPTGLKTEQLLYWRLMAGFDGNLWPPASSSTFDWSDLTVTQPLVATSRKCHQMARRKPSRPVRNHRPAVGVCREPSLWKSNSSGWFSDSQSLLCRAQEKTNPLTAAAPTHFTAMSSFTGCKFPVCLISHFTPDWILCSSEMKKTTTAQPSWCSHAIGSTPFWCCVSL